MSKQKRENNFGRTITLVCAFILVIMAVAITYFIASKGLATFFKNDVSIGEFLTGTQWNPDAEPGKFGAFPFVFGSFIVTFLAVLIAAPLSIGAAIYMTEMQPKFGKRVLKPVIELLVGIPSVVYGFIGLSVLVPFIRNTTDTIGFSILAGGIVLSVMIIPTITSLAADSLQAVPQELRNASLALGGTRWQTISRVVLRTAMPGILTAMVLGMARAFGEALAVQMVIGNTTTLPKSVLDPTNTLTSGITANMGNTIEGSAYNNALWSMSLLLLVMSFAFILIIRLIGKKKVM